MFVVDSKSGVTKEAREGVIGQTTEQASALVIELNRKKNKDKFQEKMLDQDLNKGCRLSYHLS